MWNFRHVADVFTGNLLINMMKLVSFRCVRFLAVTQERERGRETYTNDEFRLWNRMSRIDFFTIQPHVDAAWFFIAH
jgi:hypothetical protein